MDTVILTVDLDEGSFQRLNCLRREFYPAEKNLVPAHVTLFHQFPRQGLGDLPAFPAELVVHFGRVFFMGQGFAVEAQCQDLQIWRKQVLDLPLEFSSQDRSLKKLHVTLQNKESPAKAREDFEAFCQKWSPFTGKIFGLRQWRYLSGPWELERVFPVA